MRSISRVFRLYFIFIIIAGYITLISSLRHALSNTIIEQMMYFLIMYKVYR